MLGESKVLYFCFWCYSRELGREVSPRFPFVTPEIWKLLVSPISNLVRVELS